MMWNQSYGGVCDNCAQCVVETGNGGYAIAGSTDSAGGGNYDIWFIVKTDANGVMQWNQTYDGSDGDFGVTLVKTGDDGYAVAGSTRSFGAGSTDMWRVKIGPEGPFAVPEYAFGGVVCFSCLFCSGCKNKKYAKIAQTSNQPSSFF